MRDPVPISHFCYEIFRPVAEALHLNTLPFHIHEVFFSFAFYTIVQRDLSPWLSSRLFPNHYPKLPLRTKINWDIHFTSFVQSIVICTAVITVMCVDAHRIGNTWEDRIWGYTGAGGLVQGMATGYFAWDLMVCTANVNVLGPLDLIHGLAASAVALLGFRPFALYYGLAYLLFELSTPFVNIHWFLDKIDMTGTAAQWYNGIVLMVTFFSCRLLYGSYLTFLFFCDLWTAVNAKDVIRTQLELSTSANPVSMGNSLPFWFGPTLVVMNTVLMLLNFFWFSRMIEAVRKRFRPAQEAGTSRKPTSKESAGPETITNGTTGKVRRRAV